jgi:phosphohistidine phosphatase SixA
MNMATRLLVVRHAHAEPKQGWSGPDVDRPLVPRGRRQAKLLSKDLARYQPARIISSPSVRCRQTVQPLAAARALDVELSKALAPDGGDSARGLIRDLADTEPARTSIVLCTHREVLVAVMPALFDAFDIGPGHRLPGAKGGTWLLDFHKSRLVTVKYQPPAA